MGRGGALVHCQDWLVDPNMELTSDAFRIGFPPSAFTFLTCSSTAFSRCLDCMLSSQNLSVQGSNQLTEVARVCPGLRPQLQRYVGLLGLSPVMPKGIGQFSARRQRSQYQTVHFFSHAGCARCWGW